MRKFFIMGVLGISLLLSTSAFGIVKLPNISSGYYLVKMVNLGLQEFFSKDISQISSNEACLADSKADDLTIDPELEKLKDLKFGCFKKLGDNEKDIWFVMGKDQAGYYSDIYIDQNLDNHITVKEKVQGIETFDEKKQGFTILNSFNLQSPIPINISYKGLVGEIRKKVFFYLWSKVFLKNEESHTVVSITNISVLEGLTKITVGKDEKLVKFRIIDINSNGCYNDYGKDVIGMDLNFDGTFNKNEYQPLTEFFEVKLDGPKKQFRLIVLPFPGKVQVIEVNQEFDATKLETESDKN